MVCCGCFQSWWHVRQTLLCIGVKGVCANLWSPLLLVSVKNPFEIRRFHSDECSCDCVCIAQKRSRPVWLGIYHWGYLSLVGGAGQCWIRGMSLEDFVKMSSHNPLYVVVLTSAGRVLDLSMAQDSPPRMSLVRDAGQCWKTSEPIRFCGDAVCGRFCIVRKIFRPKYGSGFTAGDIFCLLELQYGV